MSKWHSGPPPSVGWWPASIFELDRVYRWRDIEGWWSEPVPGSASKQRAAEQAKLKASAGYQARIRWQHRPDSWPERSRT